MAKRGTKRGTREGTAWFRVAKEGLFRVPLPEMAILRNALGLDRWHYEFLEPTANCSTIKIGSSFEKGSTAGERQNLRRAKAWKVCFLICFEVHGIKLEVVGILVEYTLYDLARKAWHLELIFSAITSG